MASIFGPAGRAQEDGLVVAWRILGLVVFFPFLPAARQWARRCLPIIVAALLLEASGALADPVAAPAETPATAAAPAEMDAESLILDEVPEVLKPARPRTQEEEDRLKALALYSAARVKEQDGDAAGALKLYQRALRFDPNATTIAEAIVPLAVELDRHAEAVRYALKIAELGDADPLALRRLGVFLAEQGDWRQAVRLYERAIAARNNESPDAADVVMWMEMGRLYQLAAEYEKAAERFAQVLEALGNPEKYELEQPVREAILGEPQDTYNLIGETFVMAGRPEEAVVAFRKAHEIKPDAALLELHLAQVDARTGKAAEALARLEKAFAGKLKADTAAPYRLLGEVLKDLGRQDELIGRLEKLHAENPDRAPLAYFLAEQYFIAQRYDKAETLYRKLLEEVPALPAYRNLAEIYRKSGRHVQLLEVLGEAVAKTGGLDVLGEAGETILKDEPLVRTLIESARSLIRDRPQDLGYHGRLATALVAMSAQQYDAAGEFFDLAIQAKPDTAGEVLLTWGLGLLIAEQYKTAAAVLRRAVDHPDLAEERATFNYYLAGALEMDGQTEEALAAARKAVELDGDSPGFRSRIPWILYHAQRRDEAAAEYKKLVEDLEKEKGTPQAREVLRDARLVLSNLAVLAGNMSEAEEWLEQVLDEYPDDISALNDLGYLWADQNKHLEQAHEMILQAVEAEPDNAAYLDSLGWVLFRLGRFDEAVIQLEKAAAIDEPDPVILDHLGDAYQGAGSVEQARAAWRRAAEGFRKAKEPEKAAAAEAKIEKQSP